MSSEAYHIMLNRLALEVEGRSSFVRMWERPEERLARVYDEAWIYHGTARIKMYPQERIAVLEPSQFPVSFRELEENMNYLPKEVHEQLLHYIESRIEHIRLNERNMPDSAQQRSTLFGLRQILLRPKPHFREPSYA